MSTRRERGRLVFPLIGLDMVARALGPVPGPGLLLSAFEVGSRVCRRDGEGASAGSEGLQFKSESRPWGYTGLARLVAGDRVWMGKDWPQETLSLSDDRERCFANSLTQIWCIGVV